jgi:four helix bundle protein
MVKSQIKEKSYKFALEIIELYKRLLNQNERVLSKQLLKSGTSIGANVEEALAGQSRADFLSKMSIASKEARETNYWLRLLQDGSIIDKKHLLPLITESENLIRILTSIVKTTSTNNTKKHNSKLKTQN